jgi:hypothetical protein
VTGFRFAARRTIEGVGQSKENDMSVRAKFRCRAVEHRGEDQRMVTFDAVSAETPENKTWSKYTPWGEIKMAITNPAAFEQFEPGQEYMVDFTAVD